VFLLALTQIFPQKTLMTFGFLVSPMAVVVMPRSKQAISNGKLSDIGSNKV
jgi:hypothetical protein